MFVFAILDPEWLTGCLGETVGQSNKERKSLFKDFPLFCFKEEKNSWTLFRRFSPFMLKRQISWTLFQRFPPFMLKKRKKISGTLFSKISPFSALKKSLGRPLMRRFPFFGEGEKCNWLFISSQYHQYCHCYRHCHRHHSFWRDVVRRKYVIDCPFQVICVVNTAFERHHHPSTSPNVFLSNISMFQCFHILSPLIQIFGTVSRYIENKI